MLHRILIFEIDSAKEARGNAWHTDMCYFESPAKATLLHTQQIPDVGGDTVFQVRANPNGGAYAKNGSAVTGCYNPVDATSKVYELTAKGTDRGRLEDWDLAGC